MKPKPKARKVKKLILECAGASCIGSGIALIHVSDRFAVLATGAVLFYYGIKAVIAAALVKFEAPRG